MLTAALVVSANRASPMMPQTADQTLANLKDTLDGILCIDEAYTLDARSCRRLR